MHNVDVTECFAYVLFQEFDGTLSYIYVCQHFELILVRGVRVCSSFIDLHASVQVYQQYLLKMLSFS